MNKSKQKTIKNLELCRTGENYRKDDSPAENWRGGNPDALWIDFYITYLLKKWTQKTNQMLFLK
jgi:hypothetical protein